MKHSPGQGSLHRGKFHLAKEHPMKTPAGFRPKPTLKSSSSDTKQKTLASILSREEIKLLLGIYFQRVSVERKAHQHHISGAYTCS